jgi:hypothetical protein
MYDSLQPEDESTIAELMGQGHTLDQAVYEIFSRKVSFNSSILLLLLL